MSGSNKGTGKGDKPPSALTPEGRAALKRQDDSMKKAPRCIITQASVGASKKSKASSSTPVTKWHSIPESIVWGQFSLKSRNGYTERLVVAHKTSGRNNNCLFYATGFYEPLFLPDENAMRKWLLRNTLAAEYDEFCSLVMGLLDIKDVTAFSRDELERRYTRYIMNGGFLLFEMLPVAMRLSKLLSNERLSNERLFANGDFGILALQAGPNDEAEVISFIQGTDSRSVVIILNAGRNHFSACTILDEHGNDCGFLSEEASRIGLLLPKP